MFVVDKLKLNKFVHVEIPKKSEYYARLAGLQVNIPSSMYSGDKMPPKGNKTDILAQLDAKNSAALEREELDKE